MIDHTQRITGIVKAHLKSIALGEPVGFAVSSGYVAVMGEQGPGIGVGWLVTVTVPNPLLGNPDLGVSVPLQGVLPADETFREAVTFLLGKTRELASQVLSGPMPAMPQGPSEPLRRKAA